MNQDLAQLFPPPTTADYERVRRELFGDVLEEASGLDHGTNGRWYMIRNLTQIIIARKLGRPKAAGGS